MNAVGQALSLVGYAGVVGGRGPRVLALDGGGRARPRGRHAAAAAAGRRAPPRARAVRPHRRRQHGRHHRCYTRYVLALALALDGGGVRGLVAVTLLQRLQDAARRPVHELFDLIVGVSTGAIIAAILGTCWRWRWTAAACAASWPSRCCSGCRTPRAAPCTSCSTSSSASARAPSSLLYSVRAGAGAGRRRRARPRGRHAAAAAAGRRAPPRARAVRPHRRRQHGRHHRCYTRYVLALALDGGGVRGLVAVTLLQRLQDAARRPVHELFDLIVGVSTGAIIAAILGTCWRWRWTAAGVRGLVAVTLLAAAAGRRAPPRARAVRPHRRRQHGRHHRCYTRYVLALALALDGGGVRGLVAVTLLQRLQDAARRPVHELFDLIVGVSTGAIIAAILAAAGRRAPPRARAVRPHRRRQHGRHHRCYTRYVLALALDGGGVRGLVAVTLLQRLQDAARRPVHELFDLIVGVSTGAIIAAILGSGRDLARGQRDVPDAGGARVPHVAAGGARRGCCGRTRTTTRRPGSGCCAPGWATRRCRAALAAARQRRASRSSPASAAARASRPSCSARTNARGVRGPRTPAPPTRRCGRPCAPRPPRPPTSTSRSWRAACTRTAVYW
ncbi:hypothetical protein ACJJTC_016445 [Scirpophaga incertulas]